MILYMIYGTLFLYGVTCFTYCACSSISLLFSWQSEPKDYASQHIYLWRSSTPASYADLVFRLVDNKHIETISEDRVNSFKQWLSISKLLRFLLFGVLCFVLILAQDLLQHLYPSTQQRYMWLSKKRQSTLRHSPKFLTLFHIKTSPLPGRNQLNWR